MTRDRGSGSPSGRYRWDVDRLPAQINALPVAPEE